MPGYLNPPTTSESVEPLDLSSEELRDLIIHAIAEDLGQGDLTTRVTVPEGITAHGTFLSKQTLVVAGLPVAAKLFEVLDPSVEWRPAVEDGTEVSAGTPLAVASGDAGTLLAAERVALNFLQHLSGVASVTRRYVEALKRSGTQVLDTRKTTPLWRDLEKYAVRVGGGVNHRFGLYDMILIKNNHADAAGGLGEAIRRVKRVLRGKRIPLLVMAEARNVAEVRAAVAERVDIILLDNFTRASLRRAMREIPPTILTEASGGMTLRRVRALADLGLNRISVGALTHSAAALDFALRYRKP